MTFFAELKRRNVFRVAIAYMVAAWLIVQVTEIVTDSFGAPDWVMKTLIILLAIGLPFVVIIAWAYEMTPEGIKRQVEVDQSQSITQQTGRKLNYTIIGVLSVALVFSLVTRNGSPDKTVVEPGDKSIAVLPFVNMSDDVENEYFSDGISEELLNVLVKVEGLRVASRTSSFSFKDTNTPIPEIAEALNVANVLEGSVRKSGDTIRITAQLIDVKTDSHLWSETYDRKFEDIFVIQDEISAHIVDALKVALGAEVLATGPPKPTENLAAYEDFLKGRYLWQRRGEDNIRNAITLFERATSADSGFARAWSGLAAAHLTMPLYSGEPRDVHDPLALKYAEKALALEPGIAEAHAVIADILRIEHLDWIEAEYHYRKAIELEPKNPTVYMWYSEHLHGAGRIKDSLDAALKSLELDPYSPASNARAATGHRINGNVEQSIAFAETAWELGYQFAPFMLVFQELGRSNPEAALDWIDEIESVSGPDIAKLFSLLIDAPTSADGTDAFLNYLDDSDLLPKYVAAAFYAELGRIDEAFGRLDDMALGGQDWLRLWSPELRAFRSDPRFGEMLKADGIVNYWDVTGWPETCSRDGEAVTCR